MIKQLFNNKEIRFIEKNNEYWAIATDVAKVLGFRDAFNATKYLPEHVRGTLKGSTHQIKRKLENIKTTQLSMKKVSIDL
ncbi:putative prophage antirepressor [Staphylococcus aureus]|nr:putative prophage antirepressor [Staphylococcus aureus]